MKRLSILIILIAIVFAVTGCKKDFLEVSTGNVILRQTYVKDLNTLKEYLNGIYAELSTNVYSWGPALYPEIIADDVRPHHPRFLSSSYKWNQVATETPTLGLSPTAQNVSGFSFALYRIVSSANFVIEKSNEF